MADHSTTTEISPTGERSAVRYLRAIAVTIVTALAGVVAVNLAAFPLMARPENAALVQMLAGWGRTYKPILYDATGPEVVVLGRSYTRDAFDPETVGELLGLRVFNFAVSGGTPYENRRFAQSAALNPQLKAVVLSFDSFLVPEFEPKAQYGFDESILNVGPDGRPTGRVWLSRAAATTLSGAAVGANIMLLSALARHALGASKEELLPSYERRDNSLHAAYLAETRARVFPQQPPTPPAAQGLPEQIDRSELDELDKAIQAFCGAEIDIYVYLTPNPGGGCLEPLSVRLNLLAYLREKQTACRARVHLFDFQYPNAVTLEGVTRPVRFSQYYRPDGHPRPTVGELMAAVMFGRPLPPDAPMAARADFGTDLMRHDDPVGWLQSRTARCVGVWDPAERATIEATDD